MQILFSTDGSRWKIATVISLPGYQVNLLMRSSQIFSIGENSESDGVQIW